MAAEDYSEEELGQILLRDFARKHFMINDYL